VRGPICPNDQAASRSLRSVSVRWVVVLMASNAVSSTAAMKQLRRWARVSTVGPGTAPSGASRCAHRDAQIAHPG